MGSSIKHVAGIAAGALLLLSAPHALGQSNADKESTAAAQSQSDDARPNQLGRLQLLVGSEVTDLTGKRIGVTEDVVIDARDGRVIFGLINFDESFLDSDRWYAVPWRALLPQHRDQMMLLETDSRFYNDRNGFDPDNRPDFSDRSLVAQISRRFDVQPYWTVEMYGDSTATISDQHVGDWNSQSRFEQLFDPSQIEEMSGVVRRVMRMRPLQGMQPALAVELEAGGQSKQVILGPAWFIEQQDLRIREGVRLRVEAASAAVGGEQMYIASSVQRGQQVLRLRDERTHEPAWGASRRQAESASQADSRRADDRDIVLSGSDLMSMAVHGSDDRRIGRVEDVVYERSSGQLAYLIVGSGERDHRAVPWSAVDVREADKTVAIDVSPREFRELDAFEVGQFPFFNKPEVIDRLHAAFNVSPNWKPFTAAREQTASDLMVYLNRSNIDIGAEKTFEGYITEILHRSPGAGFDEMVEVIIAGEEGRRLVHLGPEWFIEQQPFELRRGDEIRVSGAVVKEYGGMTSLIANRVQIGELAFRLRDVQSNPVWIAILSRGG